MFSYGLKRMDTPVLIVWIYHLFVQMLNAIVTTHEERWLIDTDGERDRQTDRKIESQIIMYLWFHWLLWIRSDKLFFKFSGFCFLCFMAYKQSWSI